MGHLEVKAVAVAVKKAEVTKTIITMVKRINNANPGVPRVRRAICAMDLPFSCRLTKRVMKSCTAPMKIPPRITHSQAGTKPYSIPMVGSQNRTCSRDAGKMMSEKHMRFGWNVVLSIVLGHGWGRSILLLPDHLANVA